MGDIWSRLQREVHVVHSHAVDYGRTQDESFPEFPHISHPSLALTALRSLLWQAGLDAERCGTPDWNPLAQLISTTDKILIKPNWVHHANASGLDCLVTHTSLIDAVIEYLVRAGISEVTIGDAPVQSCDFENLMDLAGVKAMRDRYEERGVRVSLRDFRLVSLSSDRYDKASRSDSRSEEADYILFDLGEKSELEPISSDFRKFRVTMYDPKALQETHRPGRHQYLIARETIDADVIINMPKLKTHKKAGMTGALKSMVGINGHKKYLPHHRKGGAGQGGDCYPGSDAFKHIAECLFDLANSLERPAIRRCLFKCASRLISVGNAVHKNGRQAEGSWYGNDTVWRTCLDIQKILHYGTGGGQLADRQQRRVLTITDAIVAGEGEGPLSPRPVELGIVTLSGNVAAADWIHSILMGLNSGAIPLVRQAFDLDNCELADFTASEIVLNADGKLLAPGVLAKKYGRKFCPPAGWVGHCEL